MRQILPPSQIKARCRFMMTECYTSKLNGFKWALDKFIEDRSISGY